MLRHVCLGHGKPDEQLIAQCWWDGGDRSSEDAVSDGVRAVRDEGVYSGAEGGVVPKAKDAAQGLQVSLEQHAFAGVG